MKLAVSNIAWDAGEDDAVLALLVRHGVQGVEIAPTKLWPKWEGATPEAAAAKAKILAARGLAIPAFQAVLFEAGPVALFGGGEAVRRLLAHMDRVAGLAAAMGAETLVFGAPKLRDPGERTSEDAFAEATEIFFRMGALAHARGVAVALEPNPPAYGCRFCTTTAEAARLVGAVGHPGFRLHLDSGQMAMTGEDPRSVVPPVLGLVAHVHASEPNLGGFSRPAAPHRELADALAGRGGWLSIEMRRDAGDPAGAVRTAVEAVQRLYAARLDEDHE